MKLTPAHLNLWVERNKPKWAAQIKLPISSDINTIINQKVLSKKEQDSLDKKNALSLMGLVRSNTIRAREDIVTNLLKVADNNHSTNPLVRRALFRRVANKILDNRKVS